MRPFVRESTLLPSFLDEAGPSTSQSTRTDHPCLPDRRRLPATGTPLGRPTVRLHGRPGGSPTHRGRAIGSGKNHGLRGWSRPSGHAPGPFSGAPAPERDEPAGLCIPNQANLHAAELALPAARSRASPALPGSRPAFVFPQASDPAGFLTACVGKRPPGGRAQCRLRDRGCSRRGAELRRHRSRFFSCSLTRDCTSLGVNAISERRPALRVHGAGRRPGPQSKRSGRAGHVAQSRKEPRGRRRGSRDPSTLIRARPSRDVLRSDR